MRTLQEAIDKMQNKGAAGASLRKHLNAAGIYQWNDITRSALYEFHDHLTEAVAPSTAKTVMAYAKALFNRYCEDVELPKGWQKILSCKNQKPMKTYLTETELNMLSETRTHTPRQEYVKNVFLICAYTGLRVGDAMNLTTENISEGVIRFVAQKTKKAGVVPLKPGLEARIAWVAEHPEYKVTPKCYNEAIRELCKKAGINDEVIVLKGGKELKGPKYEFITSHSARISMATCLNRRGVATEEISRVLQHSSSAITARYIIPSNEGLSSAAMAFFS